MSRSAADHRLGTRLITDEGVAVFTLPRGGLMYEAAVVGQKFSDTPM